MAAPSPSPSAISPPINSNGSGGPAVPLEKSIYKTPYYTVWKESLQYAMQTFPTKQQMLAHIYTTSREFAARLPGTKEGAQQFLRYIQTDVQRNLIQALGESP